MKIFKLLQHRKLFYGGILFLFLGVLIVKSFGWPPYYETKQAKEELASQSDFDEKTTQISGKKLHLVYSGSQGKPAILFIHGSPGKWDAWADYLLDKRLREHAFMIAVDRIGFGGSDNGHHEPSLKTQADIITRALNKEFPDIQNFIVVGHSYGGPVALRMAVDYPNKVAALALLAPSIDPDHEDVRWYHKLANLSFIRPILPKPVDRSNQEIIPLHGELLEMRSVVDNVRIPVTVVQGKKDSLVLYQNALFAKEKLVHADVKIHLLPDRGHFIPWQEYDLVMQILKKFISVSD